MTEIYKERTFLLFLLHRFLTTVALQILSVTVAWHVYNETGKALYLGLVGLAIFLPNLLMALPGGRLADLWPRRRIMLGSLALFLLGCLNLVIACQTRHALGMIYGTLVFFGVARALGNPATSAYLPQLVGNWRLPRAVAINSGTFQIATIVGPSLAGLLYAASGGNYGLSYAICSALLVVALICLALLPAMPPPDPGQGRKLELLSGLRFVWQQQMIFGAISLDLFAVLLGGATALLPVFARDILQVGATGLGLMRSAPAAGAALMAILLAYRPLRRRVGRTMLIAVAIFGLATVVFGLSRSFYLSILCLFILGAADMISVVIRQTLIQLHTPDHMRGRVSAVSMVFIGASNELGEFESGVTAAWWGTVPAVVVGGVGTCLVVLSWALFFPALRRVDRLTPPESV